MVRILVAVVVAAIFLIIGYVLGSLIGLNSLQGGLLVVAGLAFGLALGILIDWLIEEAIRRNRELIHQIETTRQLPAPAAAAPAGLIVSGESNEVASHMLADVLRQRDNELGELRARLTEADSELDKLRDEFQDYTRTHPDDLTVIRGIGPVFQWKLRDIGVNTYQELASADKDQLRRMLGIKDWQRVDIEGWIAQARDWAQRSKA